jgi:hypothetical protein
MTPEMLAKATTLYKQGHSLAYVGELLGMAESTIHRRLKKAGVRMRGRMIWSSKRYSRPQLHSPWLAHWTITGAADPSGNVRPPASQKNPLRLRLTEVVLEVDMQALAAGGRCLTYHSSDQLGADVATLMRATVHDVKVGVQAGPANHGSNGDRD